MEKEEDVGKVDVEGTKDAVEVCGRTVTGNENTERKC